MYAQCLAMYLWLLCAMWVCLKSAWYRMGGCINVLVYRSAILWSFVRVMHGKFCPC